MLIKFINWVSTENNISIIATSITLLNLLLTTFISIHVYKLSRMPEYEKVSHRERMNFIHQGIVQIRNDWEQLSGYIDIFKNRQLYYYGQLLDEQQKKSNKYFNPKNSIIRRKKKIYIINDVGRNKLNQLLDNDEELNSAKRYAVIRVKPIVERIIEQYNIQKYILPRNSLKMIAFIKKNDFRKLSLDMLVMNHEQLKNGIEYIHKYKMVLELSYYSGLKPKIRIRRNTLGSVFGQ